MSRPVPWRRTTGNTGLPFRQRRPSGAVDLFDRRTVRGWVEARPGSVPVRIDLVADGVVVAATRAPAPLIAEQSTDARPPRRHREVRPFRLSLRDLWAYLPRGARLSVLADGTPLPIDGHGTDLRVRRQGTEPFDELVTKLADGWVFSRRGVLQRSKHLDLEWQRHVTELYGQVRRILRDEFDHDLFLAYGTLLGAVREGSLIPHDDDFDTAYLSRHADPAGVKREFVQIGMRLTAHGLLVDTRYTALHIVHPDDPSARFDVFHLYFDPTGDMAFPFGVAGTSEFTREDWKGLDEIDFLGVSAAVPVASTKLLERLYGADWQVPKPGFDWRQDRVTFAAEAKLDFHEREDAYWSNFWTRYDGSPPSPFCAELVTREDTAGFVVDIGCGAGADALGFAGSGRVVLGLDRNLIAVAAGERAAAATPTHARPTFAACDVADVAALGRHIRRMTAQAGEAPVLYFVRFLLHNVRPGAQHRLLETLSRLARPGDQLGVELRTTADESLPKAYGNHFRRFQDGTAFLDALTSDHGFEVVEHREGTGLPPLGTEDPILLRILARRR